MLLKRIAIGLIPSFFVDRVRHRRAEKLAEIERQKQEIEQKKREEEESAASRAKAALHANSWEDACARAGSYDEGSLSRFRSARAMLHVIDGSLLRSNLLALVAHNIGTRDITVTDFGGSTGELGADFVRTFPDARYIVVENKTLVSLIENSGVRSGISFTSDMPESCDIFYTSGTLQYLDDPMGVLRAGFHSARHAVVLRRNNFSHAEKFDIQKSRLYANGIGPIPQNFVDREISHPRRTVDESDVVALASSLGFVLVVALPGEAVGDEMYDKQLVFWRNPE